MLEAGLCRLRFTHQKKKREKDTSFLRSNKPIFQRDVLRSQSPGHKKICPHSSEQERADFGKYMHDLRTLSGHGPRAPRQRGNARGT